VLLLLKELSLNLHLQAQHRKQFDLLDCHKAVSSHQLHLPLT
jgi:hypothetical protein